MTPTLFRRLLCVLPQKSRLDELSCGCSVSLCTSGNVTSRGFRNLQLALSSLTVNAYLPFSLSLQEPIHVEQLHDRDIQC